MREGTSDLMDTDDSDSTGSSEDSSSTVSEERVGWCMELGSLYLHAAAYQSVRTLRLCRLRQAKHDLPKSYGTFDFSMLPREVFDMVLDAVTASVIQFTKTQEPWIEPECECHVYRDIWSLPYTLPLFDEWCLRKIGVTFKRPFSQKDKVLGAVRRTFEASPQFLGLRGLITKQFASDCEKCGDDWTRTWQMMTGNWRHLSHTRQVKDSPSWPPQIALPDMS